MKKFNNPHASNDHNNKHPKKETSPNPKNLHQGQGPEFQTQDKNFVKKNEGVQQLRDESETEDYKNVGEGDAALPEGGSQPE
jgi:hypothetical protein